MEEKYLVFFDKVGLLVAFGIIYIISFTCLYTIRDVIAYSCVDGGGWGPLSLALLYGVVLFHMIKDLCTISRLLRPDLHEFAATLQEFVLEQWGRLQRPSQ